MPSGNEFQVNTYTTGHQWKSSVAALPNGKFVITWISDGQDSHGFGVYGQIFSELSEKIGDEFRVNSGTTGHQAYPRIVSLSNNNFVITWEDLTLDQLASNIQAQIFSEFGEKLGPEFQVNTYSIGLQAYPAITTLYNGTFVIVWTSSDQDGDEEGVYGQCFSEDGEKIGPEFQVNTYSMGLQAISAINKLSNGNFVVAWWSDAQDGSGYGIYAQIFSELCEKIGPEFQVNPFTIGHQWNAVVIGLPDNSNRFVITMIDDGRDGDGRGIYGQFFLSSGEINGTSFQVNTYIAGDQWWQAMTVLPNNDNLVVVWQSDKQDKNSGIGVYGQLFNMAGRRIGTEFQVNTYKTDAQYYPDVATLSNGNIIATWTSTGQDGSQSGIVGRILDVEAIASASASLKPTLPGFASTLLLTRMLWQAGKNAAQIFSHWWYSTTKAESVDFEFNKASYQTQLLALSQRAKFYYFKNEDYTQDDLRWQIEDFFEDFEKITDKVSLTEFNQGLVNVENRITRLEQGIISRRIQPHDFFGRGFGATLFGSRVEYPICLPKNTVEPLLLQEQDTLLLSK